MFTFQPHVEWHLLLHFLGWFGDLVKLRGVKPRERNRKRITKVRTFFSFAGDPSILATGCSVPENLGPRALFVCTAEKTG